MEYVLIFGTILVVLSVILFVAVLIIVMNFKTYATNRDINHDKRLDNLEILMLTQFQEIIDSLKKIK